MRRSWDCSVVSLDVRLLIRRREAAQSSQPSFWKNEKHFENRLLLYRASQKSALSHEFLEQAGS